MATLFSQIWQTPTVLPVAKSNGVLLAHGNRLYHIAGSSAAQASGTQEVYSATVHPDGSVDPWTIVAELPVGLAFIAAVTYGDWLYVLGGFNTSGFTVDTVYTIKLGPAGPVGNWVLNRTPTSLPNYRNPGGLVVVDDYLYSIAGATQAATTGTAWSVKLSSGQLGPWRQLDPVPVPVQTHAVVHDNGWLHLIGGSTNGASSTSQASVYSARVAPGGDLGRWNFVGVMPAAMDRVAACVVDRNLAVFGGRNTVGGSLSTVYTARLDASGQLGAWQTDDAALPNALRNLSVTEIAGRIWLGSGFGTVRDPNVYSIRPS